MLLANRVGVVTGASSGIGAAVARALAANGMAGVLGARPGGATAAASAHGAWPYLAVYAASKAAVHTLSDGLRAEVAGRGIRVMTIEIHNVGGTEFATNFDPQVMPAAIKRWEELGLLSRESAMITADDVARAVVFQLSHPDPASIHHLSIRSRAN